MLNIFWRYWKDKVEGGSYNNPIAIFVSRKFGVCLIMICSWLLLLTQVALATSPLIVATKTVSPEGPQQIGATLTYTIVCTNIGAGTATEVMVTDQVPNGTKLVIGSMVFDKTPPSDSSIMVSHDGGRSYDNSYNIEPITHGRWEILAILPGEAVTMGFKVVIQP